MKSSRKSRYPSGSPARVCEDAQIWMEWQKQLTAYVAWVNSQLKKKPGAHLVKDLRHDVRDGVALIDLIHVIANEDIEGVHPAPSTYAQMKENVDKVLQFMLSNKIKMHHITTRDIVEGNLKAIMRLVLALAAHYKPNSVRHSSQQSNKQNITGLAQGAAAALTEARRNATRAGHRYRRRRQREDSNDTPYSDSDNSQNSTPAQRKSVSMHHPRQGTHHQRHHHTTDQRAVEGGEILPRMDGRAELEGASASSSPVSSHNASPRASLYLSDLPSSMEGLLMASVNKVSGAIMVASCESDAMADSGYNEILDSVKETHQLLFHLHDLLLNGGTSDHHGKGIAEGSSPKETITILKARVLHNEEIAETLRTENNKVKNECRELQGIKAAVQQRLVDQENQLTMVKSEIMSLELEREKLALDVETLKKQLTDREQVLSDVKKSFVKQLEDKDRIIGDLRRELLKREHTINMINGQPNILPVSDHGCIPDGRELAELALLLDNFRQARTQISCEDPRNSVMEALDVGLTRYLDRAQHSGSLASNGYTFQDQGNTQVSSRPVPGKRAVMNKEPVKSSPRPSHQFRPNISPQLKGSPTPRTPVVQHGLSRGQMTRTATTVPSKSSPGRTGKSQIPVLNDLNVSGGRPKSTSPNLPEPPCTNVIYYTVNSDKPFTCQIRKKLGEIRLRDLKSVIPDSNVYHYFFKALDPEYGSVKEELSNDDDLLPGWEGKIVAWLEEETGTAC